MKPSENLFINALPFCFPAEPVTFYFSATDKPEIPLGRLQTDQLISPAVRELFPDLPKDKPVFTSFDRPVDDFIPYPLTSPPVPTSTLPKSTTTVVSCITSATVVIWLRRHSYTTRRFG